MCYANIVGKLLGGYTFENLLISFCVFYIIVGDDVCQSVSSCIRDGTGLSEVLTRRRE